MLCVTIGQDQRYMYILYFLLNTSPKPLDTEAPNSKGT